MEKTQIQVPHELFRQIRAFAKRREWSLAETFRRSAELLLEVYPDDGPPSKGTWSPPSSADAGWRGLSAEQLRDAAFSDADPVVIK